MIFFIFGILVLTFIEYIHHRDGGHFKTIGLKLYRSHMDHHADPQEGGVKFLAKIKHRLPLVLVSNLILGIPALLLSYVFLSGPNPGLFFMAGINFGYLYSEWFHHRMHHKIPKTIIGMYFWRHHYIHHFTNTKVNYGFTSPIWDIVFGTYKAAPEVIKVPTKQAPLGLNNIEKFKII